MTHGFIDAKVLTEALGGQWRRNVDIATCPRCHMPWLCVRQRDDGLVIFNRVSSSKFNCYEQPEATLAAINMVLDDAGYIVDATDDGEAEKDSVADKAKD